MPTSIHPEALRAALARGAELSLLDVRRPQARALSPATVRGACWRDPAAVAAWSGDLDRACPVVVFCVHGHEVSQGVAAALELAGFQVHYLEGGLEAWRALGGAMTAGA